MDWAAVKRRNTKQSLRKAKRERTAKEREARVERAGGPFTSAELKAASLRMERPAPGCIHERFVLTIRGRDWVLGWGQDGYVMDLCPFKSWRMDPDMKESVPVTPGARKTLKTILDQHFNTGDEG
jgi:hypothetical protein